MCEACVVVVCKAYSVCVFVCMFIVCVYVSVDVHGSWSSPTFIDRCGTIIYVVFVFQFHTYVLKPRAPHPCPNTHSGVTPRMCISLRVGDRRLLLYFVLWICVDMCCGCVQSLLCVSICVCFLCMW